MPIVCFSLPIDLYSVVSHAVQLDFKAAFFSVRCIFHSKVPITLLRTLCNPFSHGLRMPSEETAFTGWPKIHSHSKIFRYGRSICCLPHRPKFSDFFDLCLHWVSVVHAFSQSSNQDTFLIIS